MKILLAEDQAMIRGALVALLTLAQNELTYAGHFEIIEVEDGEQAINALKKQHFDLLLTDIEMPHKTGLDLNQWLQFNDSNTKVIILTTFGRAGYIKRALEYGVNGFLLKDAPSDDLIKAIKQVKIGRAHV